ncbi:type II secretion system F family protein [Azonexus sp.]|uniref:type II secretion system F family protein n=1 Tax=Azonexus sp. TaxID=1872668 RepID=UPI0035B4E0B1
MSNYWPALVLGLLAGAATLIYLQRRQEKAERRRRFEAVWSDREEARWLISGAAENKPGGQALLRKATQQQSITLDLRRAGWNHPKAQAIYITASLVSPLLGAALGLIWSMFSGHDIKAALVSAFIGFGIGYLLPPRIVRWRAGKRQKAISEEMLPILHLLRMLFDAGLSLEHSLRVITEQGRELAPEMTQEIALALARINSGQERTDAIEEMAAPLQVAELDDTVAILKQATRYGGSLRESLVRLIALIEERKLTNTREYVNKLSAKMTMVMIIFMFPALMIFLAGPGFLSLTRALGKVS